MSRDQLALSLNLGIFRTGHYDATFSLKRVVEWRRLWRFPAKMTLVHAGAQLPRLRTHARIRAHGWRQSTRFRFVLARYQYSDLRKKPTFRDATTSFATTWRLKKQVQKFYAGGHLLHPVRSTTHIRVVTRHQYRIAALVSQTSFRGNPVVASRNCWLFSQATNTVPTYFDHNLPLCIRSALCLRKMLTFQMAFNRAKGDQNSKRSPGHPRTI